jgi:hypothetical protein
MATYPRGERLAHTAVLDGLALVPKTPRSVQDDAALPRLARRWRAAEKVGVIDR